MIKQLTFLEKTLGLNRAVAEYLGYSERHYYNIRNSILRGDSVCPRVEALICEKVSRLKNLDVLENTYMKKSKNKNARLGRNVGRIEFLSALEEIQSLLEIGYDLKKTHDVLVKSKSISMSYSTFCALYKKYTTGTLTLDFLIDGSLAVKGSGECAERDLRADQTSPVTPQPQPNGRRSKSEPFSTKTNKTLIKAWHEAVVWQQPTFSSKARVVLVNH